VAVLPKFLVPVSLVCSCSESEIIKDVGEGSAELSFARRWVSKDWCAPLLPDPARTPGLVQLKNKAA